MGLNITTDLSVLKGKTLVNYTFKKGSEYVLHLQDKHGDITRVRIPQYIASAFEMYWSMTVADDFAVAA